MIFKSQSDETLFFLGLLFRRTRGLDDSAADQRPVSEYPAPIGNGAESDHFGAGSPLHQQRLARGVEEPLGGEGELRPLRVRHRSASEN